MPISPTASELNKLTKRVIRAAIEVHRTLGPGLLEHAYQACLCYELQQANLQFVVKTRIPLVYKGRRIECAYEADIVVEDVLILEIKALESLASIHLRQLFTYLCIADRRVGLVLNFGGAKMKDGIKRVVHRFPAD